MFGRAVIYIHARPGTATKEIPSVQPLKVDVVNSNAPMLISHESLNRTNGPIDFESRTLVIPSDSEIKLTNTCPGHLMIQGTRPSDELRLRLVGGGPALYMSWN